MLLKIMRLSSFRVLSLIFNEYVVHVINQICDLEEKEEFTVLPCYLFLRCKELFHELNKFPKDQEGVQVVI